MNNKNPPDPPIRQSMEEVLVGNQMLSADCYTNSDFHEFESRQVFENSWMAIGFSSEISKTNTAQAFNILGKSLLVTRDQTDNLHVFANVCRHRGHLLIEQQCIGKKLLTCPYHAWSYALNGKFIKAPFWDGSENSAPTAEEKQKMALIPISFEVWYDIIFVNLSGDAPPFQQHISGMQKRWGNQRPASLLRCFSNRKYSIEGNWKLAAENFLDNYHLPWIHPEIGSSIEASLGLDVENIKISDNIIGFTHPSAGKDKSKTEKPLPCWPNTDAALQMQQDLFFIFPNTCLVMEGNYLWSMLLLPGHVNTCDEKLALYVVGDEAMTDSYNRSRQQLADTIYKINDQDASVIKSLQAGRQGNAASFGVYNARHDQLGKWFHQGIANAVLD